MLRKSTSLDFDPEGYHSSATNPSPRGESQVSSIRVDLEDGCCAYCKSSFKELRRDLASVEKTLYDLIAMEDAIKPSRSPSPESVGRSNHAEQVRERLGQLETIESYADEPQSNAGEKRSNEPKATPKPKRSERDRNLERRAKQLSMETYAKQSRLNVEEARSNIEKTTPAPKASEPVPKFSNLQDRLPPWQCRNPTLATQSPFYQSALPTKSRDGNGSTSAWEEHGRLLCLLRRASKHGSLWTKRRHGMLAPGPRSRPI